MCALAVYILFSTAIARGTTDADLRAELDRARDTLAAVRRLAPLLQASHTIPEQSSTVWGYQGYTYVGSSVTVRKTFTVMLWGLSAMMPVVRNLTLQQPVDRFRVSVDTIAHDSFVLTIERADGNVGWGQDLWCTYFVEGAFAKIDHPSWAVETPTSTRSSPAQELRDVLDRYFSSRPATPAPSAPMVSAAVLPLLRHLGGNFANVEQLWHMLISSHPDPRRAVVVEVGVADGASSMYAAELGVRVLAVEPNCKWAESPTLVAKARARPNLEIIHAAAASVNGETLFAGSGTGGRVMLLSKTVHRRRLLQRLRRGKHKRSGSAARTCSRKPPWAAARVPSLTLDSMLDARNISHVYIVKVDVQGFELEVLRGMVRALREQRVLYVLFEFWPRGIRQHGLDAHDLLRLLNQHGYTLFDTAALRLGTEGSNKPLNAASTFRRPVGLRANTEWYFENDARYMANFGYWTDVLAVACGAQINLDLF